MVTAAEFLNKSSSGGRVIFGWNCARQGVISEEMPGITGHPDDFDREWAYRRGYAHGAAAIVAALRSHLPEEIRRRAEVWLASEPPLSSV